jgi:hypothetical protein
VDDNLDAWRPAIHLCAGVCGDLSGDLNVDLVDLAMIQSYLYQEGPSPVELGCSDIDGHQLITGRDAQWLVGYLHRSGPPPSCPTPHGPYVPTPTHGYQISHTDVFPAHDTVVTFQLELVSTIPTYQITLPLQIRVDGVEPAWDTVVLSSDPVWAVTHQLKDPAGGVPGSLLLGFVGLASPLPPGTHTLATIELLMPEETFDREISVTYQALPPVMDEELMNYLMILDDTLGVWIPQSCPIESAGDVNADDALTAADIIYLVGYAFKSGPDPIPCAASGDVSCDGAVTAQDILILVIHVFKSGPPPCDVCALIPGTWTCP